MNKKLVFLTFLMLFLSSVASATQVHSVEASGTIYIRADGSIDPPTAPISTADNATYLLTGNITSEADGIVIERNNTVIDGAGYTIQCSSSGVGFRLTEVKNVTVKEIVIESFSNGIYLNSASCNVLSRTSILNSHYGIELWDFCNYNSISENIITNCIYGSIFLVRSSNNAIYGNNMTTGGGIFVQTSSDNNAVFENNITNGGGIYLFESSHSIITGNNITNSTIGIELIGSNNTVSANIMNGNEVNFDVGGDYPSHSIAVSNLVDGKPVYYLVNQKDLMINPVNYPEIGYLALINCTDITVESLTLKDMTFPIVNTNHSKIANNNLTKVSISIYESLNTTIDKNNITNGTHGIHIGGSSKTTISRNSITNKSGDAIVVEYSSDNTISENNIIGNSRGIVLWSGAQNSEIYGNNLINNTYSSLYDASGGVEQTVVYHNNFINNTNPVDFPHYNLIIWDNDYPSGGNYWSDYNGTDANQDGIGDTQYIIDAWDNADRYPLMGMFYDFNVTYFTPPLASHTCNVTVISNSSVSDFVAPIWIEHPEVIFLKFNVSGAEGSNGFCRVSFPTAMMNGTYHVSLNGTEIPYTLPPCSDANTSYLYFNYTHSTQEVIIIPEFPSFLILSLLFFTVTLLAVIIYRRKHIQRE